jgi:hypothetical protein
MPATSSRTLSLRLRPPAITIRDDSPTSSWIHFFRDEVSPLLEEGENEIAIYPSPVGFKNAKAKTNYIDHLKKVSEGISENEREELKHKIDEDFGLLELATNAGKSVKKKHGYCILFIVFAILMDKLGIDKTRLMARMTTQQLRLVTN